MNSAGISLDLQGNSGLFVNSSGVALRTAPGRGLQITSAGLGIDVDGSSLKLGSSGISMNVASGGGLRLTTSGVEIRAKTGGGIIVDSSGVSFDGSSVPRVWTHLYRPSGLGLFLYTDRDVDSGINVRGYEALGFMWERRSDHAYFMSIGRANAFKVYAGLGVFFTLSNFSSLNMRASANGFSIRSMWGINQPS